MRKLTFAVAVLASLGGASFATAASASPVAPQGLTLPETTWTGMRHRMMHRHMTHKRMMHRHMMHKRMMKRRMMRNM